MKIGLFYSFNTKNTQKAAKVIIDTIGDKVELVPVNVEEATHDDFNQFDNYILGVPTWWDGELPNYWDEFIPTVEDDSFKGKTFAIFGAGDQQAYPDNFVDAIGIMAEFFSNRGGKIIGAVPNKGYSFDNSAALDGDHFVGLPLDFENQAKQNKPRIEAWVKQILKEFE